MRFLHTSDLHIGKQLASYSLIEDQRFALKSLVEMLAGNNADALVIAGDIYDKATPSAEAVSLFDEFITDVAALGIPVLAIPGNHDSAERLSFAQGILKRQGVYFPPVYDGSVMKVELEDEQGPVAFWLMPFLKPAIVRSVHPDADIHGDYSAAIRCVLDSCDIDPTARNVLVVHQFVTAGGGAPDRADDELDLGGMDNVDASLFDAFDYVALGHVHRPQRVGRDTVRYAGSLLKYSVSEANRPKSVALVDIGEKTPNDAPGDCVSFELIPITPLRDLRVIDGPLASLVSDDAVSSANPDDFIAARLTDSEPQLDAVGKLRRVYTHVLGIEEVRLEEAIEQEDNDQAIDLDSFDPFQAFSDFYRDQTGKELDAEKRAIADRLLRSALEGTAEGRAIEEGQQTKGGDAK